MNRFSKTMIGAGAAALMTVTAGSPAQAQWGYDRDDGIDMGDIVQGVVIAGAAAAAIAALSNALGGDRYGGSVYEGRYPYPAGGYGYPQSGYGYGYNYGPQAAVNVCGSYAQRYGYGGRVTVTDIDRKGSSSYRVKGVIDAAYNGGYGYGYRDPMEFKCTARNHGRVTDFDLDRD